MRDFFADLHIHIGWTEKKRPVKISASKNLTFFNILYEAYHHKGLDMIGIIDAHSPEVQAEIQHYINEGIITEQEDGGLKYQDLTILLGSEIEIKEEGRKAAHFLIYLPYFKNMLQFTGWLKEHMKNVTLSSQRCYVTVKELQGEVKKHNGIFIPAHIFTPFKSVYGSCCHKMSEIIDLSLVDAVELGLSADSDMADRIKELEQFTFVTNSDAHSLNKIGREYNKIRMHAPTFLELKKALHREEGRRVVANYGLDPKLGKYHKSRCLTCDEIIEQENGTSCPNCNGDKITKGVDNRISEIANWENPIHPDHRSLYVHQVPLEFIPKLGPKTLDKLLDHFGTEMNILHKVAEEDLLKLVPKGIAEKIMQARKGELKVGHGGGGIYGKVID